MKIYRDAFDPEDDPDRHENEPLVPSEVDIDEGDEEERAKEKLPPAMPPAV